MQVEVITTIIIAAGSLLGIIITARWTKGKTKAEFIDVAFDSQSKVMKWQEKEIGRLRAENATLLAETIKKDTRISQLERELEKLKGTA